MDDILEKLNDRQKQAVLNTDGPLLIIAGAGTGKTTAITAKIAHLIMDKGIKPEEILALTFTDKAAGEMEERVDKLLPLGYADLWINTFHSFAERILRTEALNIGLPTDFKLLSATDQWLLVRQNLDEFELDYFRPLGNPTKYIHAIIKLISRAKDECVSPEDYDIFAAKLEKLQTDPNNAEEIEEVAKQKEIAGVYKTYQKLLLKNDAFDFGDLIDYCLRLFKTRPGILKRYQNQFKYILVDEFQDTNYAQYELVKLLSAGHENLTVVGDDDQCLPEEAKIETDKGLISIKNIKIGDQALTAVGRGHFSYSGVTKVFKNKKPVKYLTFKTARGLKLKVTDNHKLFCLTPSTDDKKHYFVYLMERQGLGWRMGITNDLALRLRLERSADKILGIKTCSSETEARFYETLYSLKYNIPTVCFKERDGVAIKDEWLLKLFDMINTEANAQKMAHDLNFDLNAHHYSLGAVNRGNKLRFKINLEMCQRNYRGKHLKSNRMKSPKILHLLSLQTSDMAMVKKLRAAGFEMKATKKGYRLRKASTDIRALGEAAEKIRSITGGIMEVSAKLGRKNIHTLPSLVMPAKNVLVGQYLPVKTASGIIYDRVVEINEEKEKISTVYDLEVENTHNFVANGVVVHNSIYKFRGASVSNIMQFKEDYPQSKEIFLIDNYRSSQNILDTAYRFIQRNNPDRLEVKLAGDKNLNKKLISHLPREAEILHLHGKTLFDEVELAVNKIIELYNADKEAEWADFAVLVRSNAAAEEFDRALELAKIPHLFMSSRGLYHKPIILNLLAWFRSLIDYHEGASIYRILNFPVWPITEKEIVNMNYWAARKGWSLYEIMRRALKGDEEIGQFTASAKETFKKILDLIEAQSKLVGENRKPTEIMTKFLHQSGYLKFLTHKDSLIGREQLGYLNKFYKKIAEFEAQTPAPSLRGFMELIEMELEAGEAGALPSNREEAGPDVVKIMTIHGSKGLEFKYVFICNLVDKKFPSINKSDLIELPEQLAKEILPEGDAHLQEERRLFYVGMTRAKEGLYFTSAEDYGGARAKKLSRFLSELAEDGLQLAENSQAFPEPLLKVDQEKKLREAKQSSAAFTSYLPKQFSFTQLRAYDSCPYQYRFAHILKIPLTGKPVFSFGKTMHAAMQRLHLLAQSRHSAAQADIFGDNEYMPITWEEAKEIYEDVFIDDWFSDEENKKDYWDRGLASLKDFFDGWDQTAELPLYLEYGFTFKLNREYAVRGAIDRIDKMGDGIKLVDYKTGKPKDKLNPEDKEQLLIYQMAAEEVLKEKVNGLAFHYFDNNTEIDFLGKPAELDKIRAKMIGLIDSIKAGKFDARPDKEKCKWCDFKDICDFAA